MYTTQWRVILTAAFQPRFLELNARHPHCMTTSLHIKQCIHFIFITFLFRLSLDNSSSSKATSSKNTACQNTPSTEKRAIDVNNKKTANTTCCFIHCMVYKMPFELTQEVLPLHSQLLALGFALLLKHVAEAFDLLSFQNARCGCRARVRAAGWGRRWWKRSYLSSQSVLFFHPNNLPCAFCFSSSH